MRSKILSLAAMLLACCSHAQSIPNSSFESWVTDVDGTDSLAGWTSSNDAYVGSVPQWLYPSTSSYSGTYAANINSVGFGFTGQPINGILVNGNAYIEHGQTDHHYRWGGGTPISTKPASLSGYYRYEVVQPDNAFGLVVLFKYNTSTGMRDTIGKGMILFQPTSSWQPFTVSIAHMQPSLNPDSVLTIFWASDTANPVPYQALHLDELTLNFPTGMSENNSNIALTAFPVPCGDEVWFRCELAGASHAELVIYSSSGQKVETVLSEAIAAGEHLIHYNTAGLAGGLYHYRLTANGCVTSGKLIIGR
jgi:hypothetical protein